MWSPDEDEKTLWFECLSRPADVAHRARYGGWLIAKGKVRGELLTLEDALLGDVPPPDAAAKRARFQELLMVPGTRAWWRTVSRSASIRNCGSAPLEGRQVRFEYACPRSWESLEHQASGVRYCTSCSREVFLCDTRADAENHARLGDCIAVAGAVMNGVHSDLTRGYTGRPDAVQLWARELFPAEG